MLIYVHRIAKKNSYTIGRLYVDGKKFCDTLEDKDRGLNQNLPLVTNQKLKVYGKTAIPMGRYLVSIHRWSKYGIDVPLLKDVPAFTGILIHNGVNENNTEGCILVGENNIVGRLSNGKKYMVELTDMVKKAKARAERVEIVVSDIAPQWEKSADGKVTLKKYNTLGLI
ncbi:MAG: hypothetical protein KBT28_04615 [Bacteroidales bacterium]|nr:hypothetical protein [Candidatus Colimorpha merdihippi]